MRPLVESRFALNPGSSGRDAFTLPEVEDAFSFSNAAIFIWISPLVDLVVMSFTTPRSA